MKASIKIVALSLLLVVGLSPLANAEQTDLAAVGSDKPRNDAYLIKFEESSVSSANSSGFQSSFFFGGTDHPISNRYNAVLPFCGIEHTFGCIDTIEAKNTSESQWEKLTPGEKFWNAPIASFTPNLDGSKTENPWSSWDGDSEIGLPPSEKVQVFNSALHQHGGGNSYVVKSLMSGNDLVKGRFFLNAFSLSIIPVKVLKYDPTVADSREIVRVQNYRFPKNVEFRVTMKLGSLYSQLNGWFFGRVGDAQIELNTKTQNMVIRGVPSITPVQTGYMPYPVPEKFKDVFTTSPEGGNVYLPTYIFPPGSDSVKNWIKYKDYLNSSASYESEVWQINASPKSFGGINNDFYQCSATKTGITGLLTTNATAYENKQPSWDAKEQTLSYQVAGPSLLSSGAKNLGNYLLALRTDVASCLWKSDLKNAKATVEVTNGDGSFGAQLATTTLSQRNGWLYFSASGFHFSAPTIKVKLNPQNILKITCVKGKTKKIVTGTSPKCPSGYKKQS
jgi:hypothetical protein